MRKDHHYLEHKTSLSPLTPIMLNPSLEFGQKDQGFKIWAQRNITKTLPL